MITHITFPQFAGIMLMLHVQTLARKERAAKSQRIRELFEVHSDFHYLFQLTSFNGMTLREKLLSTIIIFHIQKAVELDSNDMMARHMLGRW